MKEFACGSPECNTEFTATDREDLINQMSEHLKDVHNVQTATQTLLNYLEKTAVRDSSPSESAG